MSYATTMSIETREQGSNRKSQSTRVGGNNRKSDAAMQHEKSVHQTKRYDVQKAFVSNIMHQKST